MKKLSLYIFLVLMFCNTLQALPKCEGEDYAQWTNCQGTYLDKDITKPDNESKFKITRDFTGEFGNVPGQRHGKGFSKVYKDGNLILTYFGEFKEGKPNGQGTEIFSDGDKYVGEFKDGKFHGQGTYTWPNGDKYVGEWKDGKFHGQGTFTGTDGTVKKGIWKNGKLAEPN
jgi:hypothetical protein